MNDSTPTLHPIFEKNLQALFQKNAPLAAKLFTLETHTRFEVFMGKDPIDINLLDTQLESFLYANPANDIATIIDQLNQKNHLPYRYFFGLGNGIGVKLLLESPNLQRLIIFEPQIEIYYIVLHLLDFSEPLLNGKLIFDSVDAVDLPRAVAYFSHPEGKLFSKLFELETLSPYYEHYYTEEIIGLVKTILDSIHAVIIGHGNDPIDTLMGIEHHIIHLPKMIEGPKILDLIEQKATETIIIVSTGPSLTKQLPLLKKIQDHVTIISVDASFPILEKHGIKPDFVTILERVPETAKFFENNDPEFQKNVNFISVSIAHPDTIHSIRHGNLLLVMRPHHYTQYFGLKEYGYLGIGMSAANLAHELAMNLGPKQIVFIGQDLAFGNDNTSHASGHTFTENEEHIDGHNEYVERYGGNGVIRTTQYWILFKNYIERAIAECNGKITNINSTEGGARIPGTLEIPFSKVIDTYINFNEKKPLFELKPTPVLEVEKHKKNIIEKINFWIADSITTQETIEEAFIKIQEASERFIELLENDRLNEIDNNELIDLMDIIDHVKGLIDEMNVSKLYFDTLQSFLLHFELEFAKTMVKPVTTEEEKTAKMVEWIMLHRYWLFSLAGSINAERMTIIRAVETWPLQMKEQIVVPEKKEIEIDQEKYQVLLNKAEMNRSKIIDFESI